MSQGSLLIIYVAEIAKSDCVIGATIMSTNISNVVQGLATPYILNSRIGVVGLFFIFAIINLLGFLFVTVFLKETKGLA